MRPFLLYLHLILLLSSLLTPLASVFSIKNDRLSRLKRETATEETEMSFEEMETKYENMTATVKNYSQEIEETTKSLEEVEASMAELNRTAIKTKKDHLEKVRIRSEKNKAAEDLKKQKGKEKDAETALELSKIGLDFSTNNITEEVENVQKKLNKLTDKKNEAVLLIQQQNDIIPTLQRAKSTAESAVDDLQSDYETATNEIEQHDCKKHPEKPECDSPLSIEDELNQNQQSLNDAVQVLAWAISNRTEAEGIRDNAHLALLSVTQELNRKKLVKESEEQLENEKRNTLAMQKIVDDNPVDIAEENRAVSATRKVMTRAKKAVETALATIGTKRNLLESLNKNKDKLEKEFAPLKTKYEAEKQRREKSAEASFPFFIYVIIGLILLLLVLAIIYFLWYKKKSQQKKNPDPTVLLESGTVQTSTKRNSAKDSATETKDTDPSKVNNSSGSDQQDVQRQKVRSNNPVQQAIDPRRKL